VSADDLVVAGRFLDALAAAAATGDREPLHAFLAADVEWEMHKRVLRGIDEVREGLAWVKPPDNLDVEFERGDLRDLGVGRLVVDVHETYRVRGTGDFAYARDRRIELTIREGRVVRYEMRVVG
jgi:hypothetical protein